MEKLRFRFWSDHWSIRSSDGRSVEVYLTSMPASNFIGFRNIGYILDLFVPVVALGFLHSFAEITPLF